MLVNCNSCEKKFNVPDTAVTENGRLLQCGSCGNKWTQYPIKQETVKKEKLKKNIPNVNQKPNVNKVKKSVKKKKREINLYSEEYLKKKHGILIKDTSKNGGINKNKKNNYSFFSYLFITTIFIIAFFGVLNLTKEIIISTYPLTETYINSLYEVLEILRSTISSLAN
jgi:predicted Zn finger-like uncharacterized protein|tara:strand:- start:9357 stop:9860 length:504 start_codon:yes stop_codon:yes gene_type:complete